MTSQLSTGSIPTTAAEWTIIRDKILATARSPYTPRDKRVLWCQGIIVCLSGFLYLAALMRRASESGLWCFKKDVDGYWRPNVHVAIPLVTIIYAATQSTAIGLILIGPLTDGKGERVVALNLVACSTLYFGGWTKTWAVLYALPSSIFRLRRRDVLGSTARITRRRVLPPKVFNSLILIGYLTGLLPVPWLCFTVYWVQIIHRRLEAFELIVNDLIGHLSAIPQDMGTSLLLAVKTGRELLDLQDSENQTLNNLRIFSGIWFLVSFTALIIFLSASFALLLAFTRQIEILGRIQREREQLVSSRVSIVSAITPGSALTTDKADWRNEGQKTRTKPSNRIFERISVWLPSLQPDEDDDPLDRNSNEPRSPFERRPSNPGRQMWLAGNEGNLRQKVAALDRWDGGRKGDELARKHRKRMIEYCVRYTWQTVFCTLIATSYIVLNIFVVCNVLDAPRSISLSQLFRTIEQWASWSWGGGPGAVLGLLACVVAFSRNPSLPREPESGPPVSTEMMIDQDSEDDEEHDRVNGLPDTNALTFEKLQAHALTESSRSLRTPHTQKTMSSRSGARSGKTWRIPFPKAERSYFSNTSRSKNTSANSEISTTLSQGWSPYQVSLNTASLVTRSPARQCPVSDIYHVQKGGTEQIRIPPKSAFPHQIQRQNSFGRTVMDQPIRLYPLPVQVPRSDVQEEYISPPSSPAYQTPNSPLENHFDAIHKLRNK
ncbi:uncharacterized protein MELLADRAFT_107830 [Melampsora larici-populina 98AG31]|uniref:Uncharacterized protein n=1 Tax=Melampsora larici-populina (strain 98AG31 / pathotype 3-4-7) TaxID=747676 RepID=F4RR28_MELLP|nr:uncharacterized protein MELLADRAFT_107830 [Melampsora larici-populina 98AG31]EGG05139.1 hypothetical protein MELLADRAFT_107830 [Melampsora larici-populina 98AG31]